MPLYEYQCLDCGHRSEEIQRLADPPLEVCPACGGRYQKQLSAPAFQFKGSGWYITDYARSGKGGETKAKKSETASETKGESSSTTAASTDASPSKPSDGGSKD